MGYRTITLMNPESLNGQHLINGVPHIAKVESSPDVGYYIALHAFYRDKLISQVMIWADLNDDETVSISHSIKKCELFTKAKERHYKVKQEDIVHANGLLGWCKRTIKFPFK